MNLFGKLWWVVYVLAIIFLLMGIYASNTTTRQISLGSVVLSESQLFTMAMAFFLWSISITSAQPTGYLIIADRS